MIRLFLRYPLSELFDIKTELRCPGDVESITRQPNGEVCVVLKGQRHYIPSWRIDRISAPVELPEEPSEHHCEYCPKSFETVHALKVHIGKAHGRSPSLASLEST